MLCRRQLVEAVLKEEGSASKAIKTSRLGDTRGRGVKGLGGSGAELGGSDDSFGLSCGSLEGTSRSTTRLWEASLAIPNDVRPNERSRSGPN